MGTDIRAAIKNNWIFIDIWNKRERISPTDNVKFYLLKSLKNRIIRQTSNELRRNELHHNWQDLTAEDSFEDSGFERIIDDEETKGIGQFCARRAIEVDLLLNEPEVINEPKPFACEKA